MIRTHLAPHGHTRTARRGLLLAVAASALGALATSACLEDDFPLPPLPPVLRNVPSPTGSETIELIGAKQSATALLVNDAPLLPLGPETGFRVPVTLRPGVNTLVVVTEDARGRRSEPREVSVELIRTAPAAPVFVPLRPRTRLNRVRLTGTKPANTTLMFNGTSAAGVGDTDTAIDIERFIAVGRHRFRFAAVDAAGNESELAELRTERFEDLPVQLDPIPDEVETTPLELAATCDDDIVIQLDDGAAVACQDGGWSASLPLTPGGNTFTLRLAFAGELNIAPVTLPFTVTYKVPSGDEEETP
jgi:hypothetical protein